MKSKIQIFIAICFSLTVVASKTAAEDWPRFRGPNGAGSVAGQSIPAQWSAQKNLKWSVDLPGKGSSSPIVAGDRVYVTCYTGYGLDRKQPGEKKSLIRHLLAFDRASGKELWRASVKSEESEDSFQGFIQEHGYASSTPTVDDERVYAFFGKSGLFAFDLDGKQVWSTSLGIKSDPAKWGGGSSPILYQDLIVVNAGVVGNQLVAINKRTGEKVWSLRDAGFTNCWSTPTIVRGENGDQILFNVPRKIIAVDPATGKKLWETDSPLTDATCASVVHTDGIAYVMGGRAGRAMAFRCGGQGNVSNTNTLWSNNLRAGICTPLIVGKNLYWTSGGIFFAADRKTGEYVYRQRLPRKGRASGGFRSVDYSSPVAAGENIVLFTRFGEGYVIKAGDEFQLVGHNESFADDASWFNGTPAISDGELFVRSEGKLYCIGSTE